MADDISRRKFVADVGLTTAGFAIVPRHVLGKGQTPPSDKLNVACVGAGGQGRSNMVNMASQNIVALADVDWDYAGAALDRLETGRAQHSETARRHAGKTAARFERPAAGDADAARAHPAGDAARRHARVARASCHAPRATRITAKCSRRKNRSTA
jgi:hypothetical protein